MCLCVSVCVCSDNIACHIHRVPHTWQRHTAVSCSFFFLNCVCSGNIASHVHASETATSSRMPKRPNRSPLRESARERERASERERERWFSSRTCMHACLRSLVYRGWSLCTLVFILSILLESRCVLHKDCDVDTAAPLSSCEKLPGLRPYPETLSLNRKS